MTRKSVCLTTVNSESLDISNLLELTLATLQYSKERIIHYTFMLEEALTVWRDALPAEARLSVVREDTRRRVKFAFSVEGEKKDPFDIHPAMEDDFSIASMMDKLSSGIGSELKYTYKKGVNTVTLSLPKTNHEKRIFRYNILLLMLPLTIQALMESVATNVDTLMLGFQDAATMSGVSLASVFITIPTIMTSAVTFGAAALMSQYWGTRDRKSVNEVAGLTMFFAVLFSGLFCTASVLFSTQIMRLYSDKTEIIKYGAAYLRWIAPSFVITAVYRMLFCFLQTLGSVKKSLKYALIGCGVNVVFNSILIFGLFGLPAMGVYGAALATSISAVVQAMLAFFELRKRKIVRLSFTLRSTINMKYFFVSTFSIAGQMLSWSLANNIINSAFGHMNADIISANSVLLVISGFILSAKQGFGKSVGLLIGNDLGKNQLEKAKSHSKEAISFGAVIALALSPLFVLIGYSIRLLPMDFTEGALYYMNPMLLAYGVNIFFSFMNGILVYGLAYAGGDAKAIMVIDALVMWAILVPLSLARIFISSLPVLLILLLLKTDEILSFPLKLWRCKQYKWLRNMTKAKEAKKRKTS